MSLQIINNYGIGNYLLYDENQSQKMLTTPAKLVPLDASISLTDLANKTTLDTVNLARILRHAMTNQIFCEPSSGVIAHTAASRLLAQDAALQDWVGFNTEDIYPASAKVLESLKAFPDAQSLTTTGFNFAFDTVEKEPMFVTFGKDPPRAKRMGGAMASLTGGEGYELHHFVDTYDFSDVDKKGGTLVDIGGSHGFVSVELAKKWKNMKFVVQDLSKTVDSAPRPLCADESVTSRIELKVHDFFTEQPEVGADGEYFRQTPPKSRADWASVFFPMDHSQLLDSICCKIVEEPSSRTKAWRSRHHQ